MYHVVYRVGIRILNVFRCTAVRYMTRYIQDTCIEGKLSHIRGKTVPRPRCRRWRCRNVMACCRTITSCFGKPARESLFSVSVSCSRAVTVSGLGTFFFLTNPSSRAGFRDSPSQRWDEGKRIERRIKVAPAAGVPPWRCVSHARFTLRAAQFRHHPAHNTLLLR